ncbi:hypothetical protein [Streptomyces sp. NPDC017993]|uniref:hypothetical protein n=1 Tax=Streptomyces sp. NPDC017993 TaxID=3365027 RepID=UPI0037992368
MFVRSRRRAVVLTAVTTAALAISAFTFVPNSGPANAKPESKSKKKTEWIAVKKAHTQPQHLQPGDNWTIYLDLRKNDNGKPGRIVGDGSAQCSAVDVRPQGAIVQCQYVLRNDHGTLALTSLMDRFGPGPHSAGASVNGGTRAYAEAEGDAVVTMHDERVTLRVRLGD